MIMINLMKFKKDGLNMSGDRLTPDEAWEEGFAVAILRYEKKLLQLCDTNGTYNCVNKAEITALRKKLLNE